MSLVLTNIKVIAPGCPLHKATSVGIDRGMFVDPKLLVNAHVFDGQGALLIAGLIDLRVNLREPGLEHKGTIASETRAAIHGGITTVVATPNTDPVVDSPADVRLILERAQTAGLCRVLPTAMLTQGGKGNHLSEMAALIDAGCVALAQGNRPFGSRKIEFNALKYAQSLGIRIILDPESRDFAGGCAHAGRIGIGLGLPLNSPLCETLGLGADLDLVDATAVSAHFSRLTTKTAVTRLREAKIKGLNVSCDVSLAHLIYSETAISSLDPNFHLERPLRTEDDRQALIDGVKDGTIDVIVSDHSPHETGAKLAPFPETETGMSLIEGVLHLLIQLDQSGELPFESSLKAMGSHAARLINRDDLGQIVYGHPADCVLFNPSKSTTFIESEWKSAGSNSPLFGKTLPGAIIATWVNGKEVIT